MVASGIAWPYYSTELPNHPSTSSTLANDSSTLRVVAAWRGISVATHSQVTEVWGNWQDDNPEPTREQIEQMAAGVDEAFEDDWWHNQ